MERQHRPREEAADVPDRARPGLSGAPPGHRGGRGPDARQLLDPSLIADIQRQAGNAAATALIGGRRSPAAAASQVVQRQRGRRGGSGSPASMTRTDFEAEAARYGVGQVITGTLDRQVARLNSLSGADHVGDALRADVDAGRQQWVSWDPGSTSPVYRAILAGLADFAAALGGLPPIHEIVFYKRDYKGVRVGGEIRTGWEVTAADYQASALQVYENAALQATAKVLPTRRDTSTAASPTDQPTQAQGIGRIITHELGHGLQEVAHDPNAVRRAAGPLLMERYARDIGWRQATSGDRAWTLYDVGDPAVQAAFAAGQLPEERFRITADRWQQGWHEQPISAYQVSRGPFEDFPEAVMAFVSNRSMLRQRSPARHDFVQSVITELAGRLGTPGPSAGAAGGSGGGSGAEPAGAGGETPRP